jgi:hypothetical protein
LAESGELSTSWKAWRFDMVVVPIDTAWQMARHAVHPENLTKAV